MKIIRRIKSSPLTGISQTDPINKVPSTPTPKQVTKYTHLYSPPVEDSTNKVAMMEAALTDTLLCTDLDSLEKCLQTLFSIGITEEILQNFSVEGFDDINPNLIPLLNQLKQKYEKDPSKISILGLLLGILALFGL